MREVRALRKMGLINIVSVDKLKGIYELYPLSPPPPKSNIKYDLEEMLQKALKQVELNSGSNAANEARGLFGKLRTIQSVRRT
jgi:hypothetical protein